MADDATSVEHGLQFFRDLMDCGCTTETLNIPYANGTSLERIRDVINYQFVPAHWRLHECDRVVRGRKVVQTERPGLQVRAGTL